MGNIFIKMKKVPEGESFYGKVAEIWYWYFKKFSTLNEEEQSKIPEEMIVKEALDILEQI